MISSNSILPFLQVWTYADQTFGVNLGLLISLFQVYNGILSTLTELDQHVL